MSNLLKMLRCTAGITQTQAAEAVGLQPEQYSMIESGTADPAPDQMREIADLYSVPPRLAFGCAPDELKDEAATRLIALFCTLNDTGRQMLVDYATMLRCKPGCRRTYIRIGNIIHVRFR